MKYIGLIVLVGFVLFFAVLIFNAVKIKLKARKLTTKKELLPHEKQMEYAERLGEMIRCETVSHKECFDDTEFKKLRDVVEKLFPEIHKRCEKLTFSDD